MKSFPILFATIALFFVGRVAASAPGRNAYRLAMPTECGSAEKPNNYCAPFEKHVLASDTFCRPGRACYCCEGSCLTSKELTSTGMCPSGEAHGAFIYEIGQDSSMDELDSEDSSDSESDDDSPFALAVHEGDKFDLENGFEMLILEVTNRRRRMSEKKLRSKQLREFGRRKLGRRYLKIKVTRKGVSKKCSGKVDGMKGCRRLGSKCCHSISSGTVKCREGSRATCKKIFGRKKKK